MNSAKVMEIIKKNMLSILCGVVALLAVIAAFWPVGGFFTELQTTTEHHAAMYSALQGLINQPRKLPLTDPSKSVQDDLSVFPTQAIIDVGKAATDNVSQQSKKMVDTVVALNRGNHPLLVSDALPNPQSDAPKFHFRELYKKVLSTDPAMSVSTDPDLQGANRQPNIWNDLLNAGVPPAPTEIEEMKKSTWDKDYSIRIIYVNGQAVNQAQVTADFNKAALLIPDQMKSAVATQKKIYCNPDAFLINPNVVGAGTPNPIDIWNAQLNLWIQQDVATAIAQANAKAKNVLDAPIKRLIKLSIPVQPYTIGPAAVGAAGVPAAPAPVEGGDIATLPKIITVSPTGRVCNPMYDVVQFALVIDVDASQIPFVVASISQNRLMDVYNMDAITVDPGEQQQQGFLYGSRPVVRLSLKCEALFMRAWAAPFMPDRVRAQLGIAPPAPAPQANAQ